MNVIGYIRVSTEGQCGEDRFGLEVQKEQISKYCEDNGHTIVRWVADEGESGAKEREGFDSIIYSSPADSTEQFGHNTLDDKIEAVIVAKSDRVARDINIYYYYKMMLLKKDIKLISITEDFEAFGVFAPMLEAFTLCVADMERQNINKRTTSGRRAKAKTGGYSGGRVPYGYKTVDGEYVINPDEAEVVCKVFYFTDTEHLKPSQIRKRLNALEYKTRSGKEFRTDNVHKMLNNRKTYEGYYRYGDGEWIEGKHERII